MKKTAILILMLILFNGCGSKAPAREDNTTKLATCRVEIRNVQTFVEATGTVQLDLQGGAKIVSPLAGTVEKIFVKIGDSVKRGAPLASIRSSDVSDAHSSYLSAQAQLKQAERSYELNRKLFEIGAVTKNDLLTSESNYEQSKALAEGLKKKLEIYGSSSTGEMGDALVLRAPISGKVVDVQAHIGDRFDNSTAVMTVADPSKSVVVANIYDTDAGKISHGQKVDFTSDIFPGERFQGLITYVSDVEDADSKTIKTYIKPLSGMKMLKPNMFMKIKILEKEKSLPVIPKSSMIYRDGKFYVQVVKNDQFELQEIKPVRDISEKLIAVNGLSEGDNIACSAIDMEKS